MFFVDTYALWEIIKKNPNYAPYTSSFLVCSIFQAAEFYTTLRRNFDEKTAQKYVSYLEDCFVEITVQNIIDAVEMKKKYNKQDISFIDCVGYVKAKELELKFLTGDKEFENFPNVEFVK